MSANRKEAERVIRSYLQKLGHIDNLSWLQTDRPSSINSVSEKKGAGDYHCIEYEEK